MLPWLIVSAWTVLVWAQPQDRPQPIPPAPETQPTSRPTDSNPTLRRPAQAEILKNLLARDERAAPIRPQEPQTKPGRAGRPPATVDAQGQPLLLEGTFLVERPGRLVREDGRPKFIFHPDASSSATRTIEIVPNQLLEAMERETDAGFSEFVVSAEVTRYKGSNYLILRKILRRVAHGNLSP